MLSYILMTAMCMKLLHVQHMHLLTLTPQCCVHSSSSIHVHSFLALVLQGLHKQLYPLCRRQCTELYHDNLLCVKRGKFFHLHFSVSGWLLQYLSALHCCIRFNLWMIMFSIRGPTSTSNTITTKLIWMVMTVQSGGLPLRPPQAQA